MENTNMKFKTSVAKNEGIVGEGGINPHYHYYDIISHSAIPLLVSGNLTSSPMENRIQPHILFWLDVPEKHFAKNVRCLIIG